MEQINLPPLLNQEILRNLGMANSTYLGNSEYYLNIAMDKAISYLGEEKMIELYPDYKLVKPKLDRLSKLLIKLKVWYDAIEDKKFEKIKEGDIKKVFFMTVVDIMENRHYLYEIFYGVIVKNTSLQRQLIKSDAFKILEHKDYKTLNMAIQKQQQQIQQQIQQPQNQ